MTRSKIIIVGGGLGGLAAALALAQKQFDVTVLEQADQFREVGAGIQLGPNVFRMFKALAKKKINIEVISTSEIKISVLINKKNLKKSVEILHQEFKLNYNL